MTPGLDAIRDCLEGATPGVIATCAADGTPNVAYLSQLHYVDPSHVALSFQFFNKTRQNVLANPHASVMVLNPATAQAYRLEVQYLRTETDGPLFEYMKARLAGIASHTGMADVFRLRGADIYRVRSIEAVPGGALPSPPPRCSLLPALRDCVQRLAACNDLSALLNETMDCLQRQFGIEHAMVLMLDASGRKLYAVASRGYETSGVGSEIAIGAGVIGVAARERTPIRISHRHADYDYARAVRDSVEQEGMAGLIETAIPLPGLGEPHSQLAVPIVAGRQLLGVLYVESPQDLRFSYDDEDVLAALAAQLATSMRLLHSAGEGEEEGAGAPAAPDRQPQAVASHAAPPAGQAGTSAALVRHYPVDGSVFLDGDYLIKGVAGWILWALLTDLVQQGRTDFTNRELRLDPRTRLPDVSDNLEARLILLQRRLAERDACVRIEKTGRGRLRLSALRPLRLEAIG